MSDIEVITGGSEIVEGTKLQIKTSSPQTTNITLDTTRVAEVSTNNYVLSPGGLYGSGYSGGIPGWLRDAIDNKVFESIDGTINLDNLTDSLRTLIEGSSEGVNQTIVRIDNAEESLSGLITTLKSELNNNYASIASVQSAYVTKDSASTANAELQQSIYDENEATVLSLTNTFTSKDEARASSIDALSSTLAGKASASLVDQLYTSTGIDPNTGLLTAGAGYLNTLTAEVGGLETTLTDEAGVFVGAHEWNQAIGEELKIGYLKFAGNIQYQYLGGTLGENNDGWVRTDYSASAEVAALDSSVQNLVSVTIAGLQNQIDGVIDTWFEDYVPDITEEPWLTWAAIDSGNMNTVEQDRHTGDLFYDTSTGAGYRFTKVGEVFSWGVITDTAITTALANAATAQGTADGKRRIFVDTPYAPYDRGDIWIVDEDSIGDAPAGTIVGEILKYFGTESSSVFSSDHWVKATSYIDNGTLVTQYELYVDENLSYNVEIYSSNGNLFRNSIIDTTLTAIVFKGTEDITETFAPSKFSWERVSVNSSSDAMWNVGKIGIGSTISITDADVFGKAVFTCNISLL